MYICIKPVKLFWDILQRIPWILGKEPTAIFFPLQCRLWTRRIRTQTITITTTKAMTMITMMMNKAALTAIDDRRSTTDDRRPTTMGPTIDNNDDYYNAKTATVMTKMLHSQHILYWGTHKLQELSSPLLFLIEVFHVTVYWISS